jgi:hypothetical protein
VSVPSLILIAGLEASPRVVLDAAHSSEECALGVWLVNHRDAIVAALDDAVALIGADCSSYRPGDLLGRAA